MQADNHKIRLICTPHIARGLLVLFPELSQSTTGGHLEFEELALSPTLLRTIVTSGFAVSPRYMDRYHFCLSGSTGDQLAINAFFAAIADQYTSIVDTGRNLENIYAMVNLLTSVLAKQDVRLLDFGCGVGLSSKVIGSATIFGFDPCSRMTELANRNGLHAFDLAGLKLLPADSFDGLFASYVAHLLPDDQTLRIAWAKVRTGGTLIANCHKGQGVDRLESLDGRRLAYSDCVPDVRTTHGPYVIIQKT